MIFCLQQSLVLVSAQCSVVEMADSRNTSCGCKQSGKPGGAVNTTKTLEAEAEMMTYEGGSDVFSSNRHALHNNEAKTFNMMTFRTQDDAPFFTPRPQATPYVSATVSSGKEECHRVTNLMLRSNF